VSKAHHYEPDINLSFRDLAEHYGVAVVPARARKPLDKAKAEVGVQVVERWVLVALRLHQFFSLNELNRAIAAVWRCLSADSLTVGVGKDAGRLALRLRPRTDCYRTLLY